MNFVVKLSSTLYTRDGLIIVASGKISLTNFSPDTLLIAYFESIAFSKPSADTCTNFTFSEEQISAIFFGKFECRFLKVLNLPFSYKIPTKFKQTSALLINSLNFNSSNKFASTISKYPIGACVFKNIALCEFLVTAITL